MSVAALVQLLTGRMRRVGVLFGTAVVMMMNQGFSVEAVKAGFAPLEKRGKYAWEHVANGDKLGELHPEVTRLLSHVGTDRTELSYLPTARKFLEKLWSQGITEVDADDLDRHLMKEFDYMCYKERAGASKGNTLFDALIGCLPELNGSFPRSNRCLKAWRKIRPPGERGPMPLEAAVYGAARLLKRGRIYEGWIILLSVDCHLRGQDWTNLCGTDIRSDSRCCALMFGVGARGKEVKGGVNQGVVIHRGWIADGLIALRDMYPLMTQTFPITQKEMLKLWKKVWKKEGIEEDSLHRMRHTGAAEDVARGLRDLEGTRRRGRWKHISSVQRYTKTFLLAAERERFGAQIIGEGERFLRDPRKAVIQAIKAGPGAQSAEGKAIIEAMKKEGLPDYEEGLMTKSKAGIMEDGTAVRHRDPCLDTDDETIYGGDTDGEMSDDEEEEVKEKQDKAVTFNDQASVTEFEVDESSDGGEGRRLRTRKQSRRRRRQTALSGQVATG